MMKLASWRHEKGMTQKDFAEKIGVSEQTINNWENGKSAPRLDLVGDCCKELGCRVEDVEEFEKYIRG